MSEFTPKFERDMESRALGPKALPTAGAIAVRNEKGQLTMQKVKVTRYMAGKMPSYYREGESGESGGEESDDGEGQSAVKQEQGRGERDDPRYRRLQRHRLGETSTSRGRSVQEPEVVRRKGESSSSSDEEEEEDAERRRERARARRREHEEDEEEEAGEHDEGEEDDEDGDFERRREMLKEKARRREEEELLAKVEAEEENDEDESEEETSEDEDDESDDDVGPRLKPVFVRKRDRITLIDKEKEEEQMRQLKIEEDKTKEERRRVSVKLVEEAVRRELELEKREKEENIDLTAIATDDENEEIAYESWKVREMKRMKREREQRDALAKEKAELDRVHNMTEEERRAYQRANPRVVTNKAEKGKYKFLQKYYHRGAYFLDEEDDVLKRNFAEATLEDRFDKSVLPKVMQVKDFGKAGRTKWTHLTAEDTTDHQGAWFSPTPINTKFFTKHAAGTRNVFERPAAKKRRTE